MATKKQTSQGAGRRLPDSVRLAVRRYFPTEISARSAAYYALPEHLALLRLRAEAEGRILRWQDVAEDLRRELDSLSIRVGQGTAFNNSYELDILLHENVPFPEKDEDLFTVLRPPIRTVRVSASFLVPYWTLSFLRWSRNKQDEIIIRKVPQQGLHSTRVVNATSKVLGDHGWKRIPQNLAQTKIPDLDLEHAEMGEVRIADIVFGDLDSSPF
ncbi:MAG: hypothetical protein ACE5HD_01715 [Acidobacteriota bacterium]